MEPDVLDPGVVVAAWLLTAVVRKYLPSFEPFIRKWTPILAVLFGVGARAVMEVVAGEPVTGETLLKGGMAGAFAVFGHSQFRELMKPKELLPWDESRIDITEEIV